MSGVHFSLTRYGRQTLARIGPPVLLSLLCLQEATANEAILTSEQRTSLRTLLHQECGSCHGLLLKGGLGPALTAEALQGQSPEQIALTILHGRPGTAMPAWNRFLRPAESLWLAHFLLQNSEAAP
ncbi:cytochrome c [Alcaligenes faecalis]|uniref:c-type cytochrome n=1 Tax=Alcaligenes faecalis TaxID=511 RepID=UPI002933B8F3|nr:cytochrome c [Alcaligenes faecalis]MDV2116092.1 cytochrome c [Alcaligenes faecalis]